MDQQNIEHKWAISPHFQFNEMVSNFILSRALYVAAYFSLADRLIEREKSVVELAQETGTHALSLARLLRFLSQRGVFIEVSEGVYAHNQMSHLLCSHIPDSVHSIALMFGDAASWNAWGNLVYSIQTGKPAFDYTHGMDIWHYHNQHPAAGSIFHQAMGSFSAQVDQQLVVQYDFSSISVIVDVGGGDGSTLLALLSYYTNLSGILFDQPEAIEQANTAIRSANLHDRCSINTGDFFATVPAGGDMYFLKQILHDWDDEACLKILRSCRAAMQTGHKLLVVEQLIQPGGLGRSALVLDMMMLALFIGRERTVEEFRHLFTCSGFELARVITTSTPYTILEGIAQ